MTFEPVSDATVRKLSKYQPLQNPLSHHSQSLSDITPKSLARLWPQRLPLGKLTLLDGPAGFGLSLLSLHLAACISSGTPFHP